MINKTFIISLMMILVFVGINACTPNESQSVAQEQSQPVEGGCGLTESIDSEPQVHVEYVEVPESF